MENRRYREKGGFEDVKALGGKTVDPPNNCLQPSLKEYDIFIWRQVGGGGYGDPLDREPERVAEDVKNMATSVDVARRIYGVVLAADNLEIDWDATEKARAELRRERLVSGQGQMIDISMLDCQLAIQENALVRYLATGEVPQPLGTRHPVFTPFQVFPASDGYIAVATMGGAQDQWPLFCSAIGRLDIIDDDRFQTGWLRTQNYEVLEPILNEAMKARTLEEWLREFEALGIPCGPVNSIDKVAAREMIVGVHHPQAGDFKVVNTPVRLSRTPGKIEQASPGLGEHTDEVLKELLGMTAQEIDRLGKSGAT